MIERYEPGDAELVDFASLSPRMQEAVARAAADAERQRLRAETLFQRLAAHGLNKEAETLKIRDLYGNADNRIGRLDALEKIVATLELGPMPELRAALRIGAGTQAALRLLSRVQNPEGAAAIGERFAVAVICESDERGDAFDMPAHVGASLLDAVEGAEESLLSRLELVREALHRLRVAGAGDASVQ